MTYKVISLLPHSTLEIITTTVCETSTRALLHRLLSEVQLNLTSPPNCRTFLQGSCLLHSKSLKGAETFGSAEHVPGTIKPRNFLEAFPIVSRGNIPFLGRLPPFPPAASPEHCGHSPRDGSAAPRGSKPAQKHQNMRVLIICNSNNTGLLFFSKMCHIKGSFKFFVFPSSASNQLCDLLSRIQGEKLQVPRTQSWA